MFARSIVVALALALLLGVAPRPPSAFAQIVLPPLALNPTSGPPGTVVNFAGFGFTPGGRVSVLLIRGLGVVVSEVTADPSGGISGSFTMPQPGAVPELTFGPVDVFAVDRATGRETQPSLFTITQPPGMATTWFFAEGSTAPPFDTWYLVQNPTTAPATVTFTFQLEGGATTSRSVPVGPRSRFSLFANQVLPNQALSARIDADQPVFAERAMYVGFDGHVVSGIAAPSPTWLFAEGSTQPPFHTWLLLQNPNAAATAATVTYLLQGGGSQTQSLLLPPTSRTSIFVNQVLPNAAFSIQVRSDRPIIAERAMYRFPGNSATGVSGVTRPARSWFFAEGQTTLRNLPADTWLLLQNPNNAPVPVTITLFREADPPATIQALLPPSSRESFFLDLFVGEGFGSFGIRVEAGADIVAERSVFFGAEPRGSFATQGSPALATVWQLAEGSTAPPFDEIIAIVNPNAQDAAVTVDFQLETGQVVTRTFTVGAQRKLTINVDAIIPNAALSATVRTSLPTVVERTMLIFKLGSVGAHNTIGIR